MHDNDLPSSNGETQPEEKSFFQIVVHSFFIIPFLIAVLCALLFTGIHLLTREQRSAYDYLEDVKTGGSTKRWQGAFELSRILSNPKLIPDEERFVSEMIKAFSQSKHDDPRTRQYMALAMGRTGNRAFVSTLVDSLMQEKEGNLPALIYALGMIGDPQSAPVLFPFAEHEDSRIRSITIVALGNMGNPESKNILKNHLQDPEPNVQWGAAVSLAQMNDRSGRDILQQMLNRQYWAQFKEVDPEERNNLIINAIYAAARLNDTELNTTIQNISSSDPNLKIRSAASLALHP